MAISNMNEPSSSSSWKTTPMNSPATSTSAESFCLGRGFTWMCGLPKVRFRCFSSLATVVASTGGSSLMAGRPGRSSARN
ncbi:hypothetical protein CC_2649 [Caulobacter vibrioides CB15]|uniref:Uncharacterized protein n=1 Tax=Caulobacter vibrioides (strain ATCC 19089 / CIP 103742 / CB 15) TaxID=190650 RepID=Q9A520_CAUVC|nr:hypothetical protein CC_2649 [Caulobacter vibrioides CB15]